MEDISKDIADFRMMKTRAEFIKQNLASSNKEEYKESDVLVKDLLGLMGKMYAYGHIVYMIPIEITPLPKKMFGKTVYRKEDLVYRVEEILALIDSVLKSAKESRSGSSEATEVLEPEILEEE
jgi:hypothetical protein